MNRQIRTVSEDGTIVRATIFDERWYIKNDASGQVVMPSVTWICGFYHRGIGYSKWLANHGWDESQTLLKDAGDRGTKVHQMIAKLLRGESISIEEQVNNSETGVLELVKLEEYEAAMSFVDWFKSVNPIPLMSEQVVFNEKYNYAGTVDFVCEIDGVKWLLDFKTSQEVWPSHKLQLSAYKACLEVDKIAVLQVGYRKNKNRYKFTEVPDQFDLFLATKKIWQEEAGNQQPSKRDYPVTLKLNL